MNIATDQRVCLFCWCVGRCVFVYVCVCVCFICFYDRSVWVMRCGVCLLMSWKCVRERVLFMSLFVDLCTLYRRIMR